MKPLVPVQMLSLLLVSLVFGHPLRSDDDPSEILRKVEKKYDTVRDATISFTQHVVFGVTRAEQSFDGKLIMKRGNKYRIELDQQTIVTDGKTAWTFSPANNQVVIDNFREDPRSFTPDRLLVNVPDRYVASFVGRERVGTHDTAELKLLPKTASSSMKWMKVWVDDEGLMRRIQVLDASENLMTYDIHDLRINTGLADGQFQFTPPAGTEILDLR